MEKQASKVEKLWLCFSQLSFFDARVFCGNGSEGMSCYFWTSNTEFVEKRHNLTRKSVFWTIFTLANICKFEDKKAANNKLHLYTQLGVNFINILHENFLYKSVSAAFI